MTRNNLGMYFLNFCKHKYVGCNFQKQFFDFRKENEDGFGKKFSIQCNKNKDGCRTNNIEIKGTCCWEIFDRHGNSQDFTPGQDKEPTIAYISKLKTKKCV